MMNADILREKFLNFFAAKGHKIVASDYLIPQDDPTVLFTSAGMNQFKKQFLGQITDFTRAVSCQKCLRTDDLDKVGKTSGHHTFFEMLGNFSFGDYFKIEAISWAWEFMTEVLRIQPQRLWVSVHKKDGESYNIWKDVIKVPKEKIIELGDKENFWPSDAPKKGPNGPCGPCSEIFYDFGKGVGCKKKECSPRCNCGRFAEVWNLVFTQFQRKDKGLLEPLPNKNIDTGMGLERLAAVMQDVKNNFDTDLFRPLIKHLKLMLKHKINSRDEFYLKAISDHIRAISFAICDGVMPSNEERGYVIRKLIRISLGHACNLGIDKPFLYRLVPLLAEVMHKPYPELKERQENISRIVLSEEEKFMDILKKAPALIEERFSKLIPKSKTKTIPHSGELAFQLYDTYGIPFEEIGRVVKKIYKRTIDEKGFKNSILRQRLRSRQKSKITDSIFVKAYDVKQVTSEFIYGKTEIQARVLAIFSDHAKRHEAKEAEPVEVVLDKTVFYAQAGGQVADSGILKSDTVEVQINDVKKIDNLTLHLGKVAGGVLKVGDSVMARIDYERRLDIAKNHTATHLLQAALCRVLGEHVRQQGSLVAQDRLRFDFTHFKDVSTNELKRIEEMVNGFIKNNNAVRVEEMNLNEARRLKAKAFFAEKYQDRVLVVSIGDYSKELCGGTHLGNTQDVGLFKIISESSIAADTRRIEAVTGRYAQAKVKEEENLLSRIAQDLEVKPNEIAQTIGKLNNRLKDIQGRLRDFRLKIFKEDLDNLIKKAVISNSTKIISQRIDNADMELLRSMTDILKTRLDSFAVILGSNVQDRVYLVMAISNDLVKSGLDASAVIKDIAKYTDGSGGGRKDFGQAGGRNVSQLDFALVKAKEIIEEKLK